MNQPYYAISLDISLNCTGYAAFKLYESRGKLKFELVECSCIPNKHFFVSQYDLKLYHIQQALSCLRNTYTPQFVVRESLATSQFADTKALSAANGIVDVVLRGITQHDYSPSEWKKILTGDGRADKSTCAEKTLEYIKQYRITPDGTFHYRVDDESDACGLFIAHLLQEGVIK